MPPQLLKRIAFYTAALFIYALGLCLMARANLGMSPVSSISYIIYYLTPLSLGVSQMIMNTAMVLIQLAWLGRAFPKFQFLQLGVSAVFSVFLDLLMPLTAVFDSSLLSIPGRLVLFCASLVIMAAGLGVQVIINLIFLPGDGLVKTISLKTRWSFGTAKVVNDCICVAITAGISFACLRRIEGIQAGTLVSALLLGTMARFFIHRTEKGLTRLLKGEE
jgi:uncharacterized membrane protein YczE